MHIHTQTTLSLAVYQLLPVHIKTDFFVFECLDDKKAKQILEEHF